MLCNFFVIFDPENQAHPIPIECLHPCNVSSGFNPMMPQSQSPNSSRLPNYSSYSIDFTNYLNSICDVKHAISDTHPSRLFCIVITREHVFRSIRQLNRAWPSKSFIFGEPLSGIKELPVENSRYGMGTKHLNIPRVPEPRKSQESSTLWNSENDLRNVEGEKELSKRVIN